VDEELTVIHAILTHRAGSAGQVAILLICSAVITGAAWLYRRRPDYRKIHRMERQIGYRDLTSIPQRRRRGGR
jgi:hypothetical protein